MINDGLRKLLHAERLRRGERNQSQFVMTTFFFFMYTFQIRRIHLVLCRNVSVYVWSYFR